MSFSPLSVEPGHTHSDHSPHTHDLILDKTIDPTFRRALILVIIINAIMFMVDMCAGSMAGSRSLLADGLDFLGDTLTYSISLLALSWTTHARAHAAIFKSGLLVIMATYVFGSTLFQVFVFATPIAGIMGGVAVLALIANILSVLLVMRFRNGDANLRSVWLCSRNDMFGNLAVLAAAVGVFGTGSAWPDLIVAGLMSGLFLQTAFSTFRQARREINAAPPL